MSKPNKPGELRGVEVDAISIVSKAANKERFKIFKSADVKPEAESQPEQLETEAEVEKGEVADIFNAQDKSTRLREAVEAFFSVVGANSTDAKKIRNALSDFKSIVEGILINNDEQIIKTVVEFEKSGLKISGPRLARIKKAYEVLGNLIADVDSESEEGGTETVSKEDLINEVKKSVEEAVKPIDERLSALEKSDDEKESELEIVKSAMDEALKPVIERLERVEKARGLSNSQAENITVKKSTENFWAGAFGD